MVTGYNPNKLGDQTLTINYKGFTEQFIVNVQDYISKLQIVEPDKTEYEYGESIDLTGATVAIVMASGKVEEKADMTASMISGFNPKQEGKQTINVEYKGLKGKFQVNVVDKVKGISMEKEPNKVEYKYGESLDVTGATIAVVKSSGITTVPVTKDMVSGYSPKTPGTQLITVTYKGFTTKFIVIVAEKEQEEPTKPVQPEKPTKPTKPEKPNNKPTNTNRPTQNNNTNNQTQNNNNTITQKPEETPTTPVEEPSNKPNTNVQEQKPNTQKPNTNNKPTETLGVKDEQNELDISKIAAGIIGGLGILFLIILIFFRRNNVKIYVEENKEFVLGGTDRLSKRNLKLDIDQYLDGDTYQNRVKIHLKDSISEKLDGKEIEIKHRGKTITHKIKYNKEPYEIILD